eukprot:7386924-Prymnesium_polylepis.1
MPHVTKAECRPKKTQKTTRTDYKCSIRRAQTRFASVPIQFAVREASPPERDACRCRVHRAGTPLAHDPGVLSRAATSGRSCDLVPEKPVHKSCPFQWTSILRTHSRSCTPR